MVDAIVIGAGPNGLTAANILVDHGWSVTVVEAQQTPGGAVRSGELTRPGCVHDLFSAFYPLAAASPHLRGLQLEQQGLRWSHAPLVLAHPLEDGRCASLSRDPTETASSLERFAPGDGDAWIELFRLWQRVEDDLLDLLFAPLPPLRPAARLAGQLGPDALVRFLRFLLLPVRRLGDESFAGAGGPLLLAGNALHADFTPGDAGSGLFGWLLASLGQRVGYPVPVGGAQRLTDALVARLEAAGGEVICGERVTEVVVRQGRALGVVTGSGERMGARRAIIADTLPGALYLDLVGTEHLPGRLVADLHRLQLDHSTVKIDWLLDGAVPWTAPDAHRAGTVHLGNMTELTEATSQLGAGLVPAHPAIVFGQMNVADPSRSPAPMQTAWAYTKVPQRIRGDAGGELSGRWTAEDRATMVRRVEQEIERHAPGFRDLIAERYVAMPGDLERADENLAGGAVNGGTAQLHQELVFRPVPGLGRPETPIEGLYLGSAAAHPGGGVHGGPGANAARAALLGPAKRRLVFSMTGLVTRTPREVAARPGRLPAP